MKKFIASYLILLLVVSCRKENAPDCFKASGDEVTDVRYPGLYKSIVISDKFEVTVVQGNEHKVEVTCGEYIISNIKTNVKNDTLFIEDKNKCSFMRGYEHVFRIRVTIPHLQYLENSGVGVVTMSQEFVQDSISLTVSESGDLHANGRYRVIKTSSHGNGDMYLGGQTQDLYVYTNGINYVYTRELSVSNYMFIHTVSLGDCYVNANNTKTFDYNIQNSGNIYYTGDPQVIGNFSSSEASGRLIKE